MINLCPFDFQKIRNLDDLAYELIFMHGHDLDELKKKLSGDTGFIKAEEDKKRKGAFGDFSKRYILKATNGRKNEINGLKKLLKLIDSESETKDIADSYKTTDGFERSDDRTAEAFAEIEYEKLEDGVYEFSYAATDETMGGVFMRAYPCCPSCHSRFPKGWFDADDFCAIDFMAKKGHGKTTLLLSLMANNWKVLQRPGEGWQISAAHDRHRNLDFWYSRYQEMSEEMTKKTARRKDCFCPDSTQVDKWVSPVFLKAKYKDKLMMVGLYDNSGENLEHIDEHDVRMLALSQMFGHIYLIEPSQMHVGVMQEAPAVVSSPIKLMSIEEQGEFQRQHEGDVVLARDLLTEAKAPVQQEQTDAMDMISEYLSFMADLDLEDKIQDQHICATIIKSDLLKGLDEVRNIENSSYLFENTTGNVFQNQIARQRITKKVFEELVFSDPDTDREILESFGSVSYHCVSAIGCDTEEREVFVATTKTVNNEEVEVKDSIGKKRVLKGEYAPIRIADPIMNCLQKRVEILGW